MQIVSPSRNGDSGAGQADQEQQLHRPRPQHLHERHQAHDREPGPWKLKCMILFEFIYLHNSKLHNYCESVKFTDTDSFLYG